MIDGRAAASTLGLTYQRTMEIARAGSLRSVMVGKYRRFRPEDLVAFIDGLAAGTVTVPPAPRKRPQAPAPP